MNIGRVTRILACLVMFTSLPLFGAIQISDDAGKEITLDAPVARVVSLSPHLTEILFDLEVQDTLVGTSRYSDYPEAAKQIDVIADAFQINVEAVIARQPDLILAWHSGGDSRALYKLEQLGFPVYRNEAKTLADIASTFVRLAALFGVDEKGRALQTSFNERVLGIKRQYKDHKEKRVFLQVSERQLYSVNDKHLIGQALSLCQATNIFGAEEMMVAPVSAESVLVRKPDVIVISSSRLGFAEAQELWNRFQQFRGRIKYVDSGKLSRPSFRMLDGIEDLCRQIHRRAG